MIRVIILWSWSSKSLHHVSLTQVPHIRDLFRLFLIEIVLRIWLAEQSLGSETNLLRRQKSHDQNEPRLAIVPATSTSQVGKIGGTHADCSGRP